MIGLDTPQAGSPTTTPTSATALPVAPDLAFTFVSDDGMHICTHVISGVDLHRSPDAPGAASAVRS